MQIFLQIIFELKQICEVANFISRGPNRSRPAGAIRRFFVTLAKANNLENFGKACCKGGGGGAGDLEQEFLEALKLPFRKGAREPLPKYFLHKQDGKT